MKQYLVILTSGLLAGSLPLSSPAQAPEAPITAKAVLGVETKWTTLTEILVSNFEDEHLGRIQDLTVDLTNGRIVEVLVVSDQFLRTGGKTVAVPPKAFYIDFTNKVYRLDISAAAFKAAPAFDLDKWRENTTTDQVTAAYKYFGLVPNFLITDEAPGRTVVSSGRPVISLGLVERMSKLIGMQIDDLHNKRIGKLQSLVIDVPNGHILNTFVQVSAQDSKESLMKSSSVVPPTLFTFTEKRDRLLLDLTKLEYADQPDVIFQFGADGEASSFRQQAAKTKPTTIALVQGTSYNDVSLTAKIYKSIIDAKLDAADVVEVGTSQGRVTLRGPVKDQATKDSIGAIAIAAVTVNNVDNQISISGQPKASL